MTGPSDYPSQRIARHFTGSDGVFRFARWEWPLAMMVAGTDDAGIEIFEAAVQEVADLAGLPVQDLDEEFGANLLVFFAKEWAELAPVPQLAKFLPNLADILARLERAGANQYRAFAFDGDGAIRACIVLLRYEAKMRKVSAQSLAVGQAVQSILLWSDTAFHAESPIGVLEDGICVVKPWHAALIRAAYDPTLPSSAEDPAFALRLAGRMSLLEAEL